MTRPSSGGVPEERQKAGSGTFSDYATTLTTDSGVSYIPNDDRLAYNGTSTDNRALACYWLMS